MTTKPAPMYRLVTGYDPMPDWLTALKTASDAELPRWELARATVFAVCERRGFPAVRLPDDVLSVLIEQTAAILAKAEQAVDRYAPSTRTSDTAPFLSVRQAATRLRCHPSTIHDAIHRGELVAIDVGTKRREWRIDGDSLARWMAQRRNVA